MPFNPDFKPSTIREGRKLKTFAREGGVDTRGETSEVFSQQVSPALQLRVNEAVAAHRGWLETEWQKLGTRLRLKKPVPIDEVLPYFQKTLEKHVKLYVRTTEKPAETFAGNAGLVDMICEQAAFDFIMSLRMSAQEGETLNNALEIASLSHWLNPMDVKRLGEKYKDRIDQHVIIRAALHSPKNPDAFIDKYVGKVDSLGEKYKDRIDKRVIKYAALHSPKNPDAFIDWFIDAEQYLLSMSPRASKRSIVHQVLLSNAFKTKEELLGLM